MKKKYSVPVINVVKINAPKLLALSGGGYGDNGVSAQSKKQKLDFNYDEEDDDF